MDFIAKRERESLQGETERGGGGGYLEVELVVVLVQHLEQDHAEREGRSRSTLWSALRIENGSKFRIEEQIEDGALHIF